MEAIFNRIEQDALSLVTADELAARRRLETMDKLPSMAAVPFDPHHQNDGPLEIVESPELKRRRELRELQEASLMPRRRAALRQLEMRMPELHQATTKVQDAQTELRQQVAALLPAARALYEAEKERERLYVDLHRIESAYRIRHPELRRLESLLYGKSQRGARGFGVKAVGLIITDLNNSGAFSVDPETEEKEKHPSFKGVPRQGDVLKPYTGPALAPVPPPSRGGGAQFYDIENGDWTEIRMRQMRQ